jgi:hypothetical protein
MSKIAPVLTASTATAMTIQTVARPALPPMTVLELEALAGSTLKSFRGTG